jgi:hypothetical protein
MWISCNNSPDLLYKNNVLGAGITADSVSSSRDGGTVSETY